MLSNFLPRCGLFLPLVCASPSADLPVDDWIDRTAGAENMLLDFEVLSADGDEGTLQFAYEAPDRCRITFEGQGEVRQWIDGAVMSVRAGGDDGPVHYTIDLEELFESSELWLRDLEERLPRTKPATPRTPGPLFLIWPDTSDDSVQFKFEYSTNAQSMFAWLPMLAHREFDWTELDAGGFELSDGESLRIELEPEFGIPRSAWMGSGEDARQALRLVNMVVDADDAPEFDVPEPALDSTDRSTDMAVQIVRASWASSRASAHTWLWNRGDTDGIELSDGDLQEIVDLFESYYTAVSSPYFEQRLESEYKRIDDMIDKVLEAAADPAQRDKVAPVIEQLKKQGPEKYRQGLGQLTSSFLAQIKPVSLEDADEDHLAGMLELERQGASQFLDRVFVQKVIGRLILRIEDLG
jgi:hypothetical protein